MICGLNNSIQALPFCKKENKKNNDKLNIGVVAPPNNLPKYSLYETMQKEKIQPQKPHKVKGGSKMTAGKLSALCAFGSMVFSAFALLRFKKQVR